MNELFLCHLPLHVRIVKISVEHDNRICQYKDRVLGIGHGTWIAGGILRSKRLEEHKREMLETREKCRRTKNFYLDDSFDFLRFALSETKDCEIANVYKKDVRRGTNVQEV